MLEVLIRALGARGEVDRRAEPFLEQLGVKSDGRRK